MMKIQLKGISFMIVLLIVPWAVQAAALRGTVTDKTTKEPLIGAAVQLSGTNTGTITDMDGNFELAGLRNGMYKLFISYVSYRTQTVEIVVNGMSEIKVEMEPDDQQLEEVVVVAEAKKNTENAIIAQQRTSLVMQTGVSAQQITKTQDKDASEVIRRVPGISIIEEKFVMVRGLSQRYNNVWINNSAVPSSEADARAFSFDIIPSSQLDNMLVVKSPAPEYPADFSGGFILVNTKDVPNSNLFNISVGVGLNDQTHFKDFRYNRGSGTDFLGFDNGFRSLKGGMHAVLNPMNNGYDLLNNGLNNDWTIKSRKPIADLSLSMNFSRRWVSSSGRTLAMLGAVNYSNNYKTYLNMDNNLFGAYDRTHDRSNYLRQSMDDQYNHNIRTGAMLNFTYVPASGNSRYEFKNVFNQLGKDRYTYRKGTDAQSDYEESAEYYYQSRTTYSGQFTGKHALGERNKLDWSAGYSYANRNMPDRRRYVTVENKETKLLEIESLNDIQREFSKLDEHILSANINYRHDFAFGDFTPSLKLGGYTEYRTRKYTTRLFTYAWAGGFPSRYATMDVPNELMQESNYGEDKLYFQEKVDYRNNYEGNNLLEAGYMGASLPFGPLNIYAGVRFEHNEMELIGHTKKNEKSPTSTYYTYDDFFPSVNALYRLNDEHQFRLSYGRTINRPEFREVSTSVYYDFDLASNVQGNYDLKPAYIQNVDLGYEFYPSTGELISVSLFYKNFKNPIEWTYTVAGGTDLVYSYMNAKGAGNYGIEVDIRKNLDFIGLHHFSLSLNGALIKSKVNFEKDSREEDRPMQGQSPYLVNAGIFYQHPQTSWSAALLYNRIGKRIIGVGRSLGTGGNEVRVPDSYEMPRNAVDLSVSKKFGKLEVKAAVRDLLAEKVSFKQFEKLTPHGEIEQITRQYKPGRNFNLNVSYIF